mgnify:CR=1 FL=1
MQELDSSTKLHRNLHEIILEIAVFREYDARFAQFYIDIFGFLCFDMDGTVWKHETMAYADSFREKCANMATT